MAAPPDPRFLPVGTGTAARRIAHRTVCGAQPTLVWLGGFRSDMRGAKAERLATFAAAEGLGCVRFDYSGHGESSGRFEDGTISRWTDEAAAILGDVVPPGPSILVGSSMGAWIALRLAIRAAAAGTGAIAGLLLLAPAPDFTGRLVEPRLTDEDRMRLDRDGGIAEPSPYADAPTLYTKALLDDGRRAAVLTGPIRTGCPVHIIHGMADPDVPVAHALDLVSHLPADGVTLCLVRDGDHRLSREEDLVRMERAVSSLVEAAGQGETGHRRGIDADL